MHAGGYARYVVAKCFAEKRIMCKPKQMLPKNNDGCQTAPTRDIRMPEYLASCRTTGTLVS